jgi:cytochrome c-type biogenesis protein CcmF
MIPELGQFALVLAFGAALVQAGAGLMGGHRNAAGLIAVAERATFLGGGLVLAAFLALTVAHVGSDFSVRNVFENSHSAKPFVYKLTGVWGNHEGSMLLWILVLAGYAAAVAAFARSPSPQFRARVLGVMGLVGAAFAAFVIFTSNPFARLPDADFAGVPLDGQDLNPLLQDPGLIIHPPFLYLGYVGFAVAFSFAVAALIERRADRDWARWARPWALAAWTCMTIGVALGAWWSYAELGWGGFWAWDPVENASLMPWIAGAALIHTLKAVTARGAFKSWAFLLAILAFSLSLVGTFLVRSGLLTSVHAFAVDPERGVFILAILAAAVGGSLTLYALRSPSGSPAPFALASRETGILVNNLVLMTILGTVFLGTFYPVFVDILTGERVSVGPPYFNFVITPFALLLMFAAAIGERLPWRRGDLMAALRPLAPAGAAAVVAGVVLWTLYAPREAAAAAAIALAVWLAGGAVVDLALRVEPLKGSWDERRARLGRIGLGAWAMNLAHLGVAVVALGAAGTGALRTERITFMNPGDVASLPGGRTVMLVDVTQEPGPNYAAERAQFDVRKGEGQSRRLLAERRYYPVRGSETAEAGVLGGVAGDVYVTVGVRSGERGWPVSASFFPFTVWLWIGSAMVAAGGALGVLDHARSARRERAGAAKAAVGTAVPAPAE